jgi:hypothetical protein
MLNDVALDHTAGIVTQPYTTGCDEGRRDYLLAFCSSIPLPDESEFHLLQVRPDQKLDKIRKFGKLLGNDELPKWHIPDEAIPLEIRLDWMRRSVLGSNVLSVNPIFRRFEREPKQGTSGK